jgi:hypothetical protein
MPAWFLSHQEVGFMTQTVDSAWLSGRKARVRGGGLTLTALWKAVAIGEVRTLARPGEALRFRAADLDRLAQARFVQRSDRS